MIKLVQQDWMVSFSKIRQIIEFILVYVLWIPYDGIVYVLIWGTGTYTCYFTVD